MTLDAQENDRYRFKMEDHEAPGHFYDHVAAIAAKLKE